MRTPVKLAAVVLALAAVFGVALAVGAAVGPVSSTSAGEDPDDGERGHGHDD